MTDDNRPDEATPDKADQSLAEKLCGRVTDGVPNSSEESQDTVQPPTEPLH